MPHEWNNLIVVTKDELVPNWYSWNNLRTTIERQKDKVTGIKRVQLGGNGRQMLIDFDSLPNHVRHGLGDPRQVKHVFEKYYRSDNEALRFYANHKLADGSYLDHDYQNKYITNASVLNAIVKFRADNFKDRKHKGLNLLGIDTVLLDHSISFKKTLKVKHKTEHTLPESLKRFKQVLNDFEKKGYVSLISGKHGNNNSRKVTSDTQGLLEGMFGKDTTKPTATEIHRRYLDFLSGRIEIISNDTGEVFNPIDFKALSDSTIKKYLSAWESEIGTNALRSGDRQKYMQRFKPHHSLVKPQFAGSIISIDDRQPPFKMHNGKRPWFYNGIDLGSEVFTCFVYGKSKEGIILDFYRQLVRNYAEWGFCLPAELECESSLNSSFMDKTHENDPIRPVQKGPLCQLKVTTFAKAK